MWLAWCLLFLASFKSLWWVALVVCFECSAVSLSEDCAIITYKIFIAHSVHQLTRCTFQILPWSVFLSVPTHTHEYMAWRHVLTCIVMHTWPGDMFWYIWCRVVDTYMHIRGMFYIHTCRYMHAWPGDMFNVQVFQQQAWDILVGNRDVMV